MSKTGCNYLFRVTPEELSVALSDACCRHCGITAASLIRRGRSLEVCGDEFASDPVSGEVVLTPIALCPDCHAAFHLDSRQRHNPCQIGARRSREGLL